MRTWSTAIGVVLASVLAAAAADPGAAPRTAAATLEGSTWRMTHLRGQDEKTLAGLPNGVTIRFEGGRLQGFGGCNQLAGSYSIDRDRVTLGPLAGTMMACPQPAMEVETAFKKALTGALRFYVVEGRLTLASESDADPRLVFEAVPNPGSRGRPGRSMGSTTAVMRSWAH
jgi:heat shock protein HslJ